MAHTFVCSPICVGRWQVGRGIPWCARPAIWVSPERHEQMAESLQYIVCRINLGIEKETHATKCYQLLGILTSVCVSSCIAMAMISSSSSTVSIASGQKLMPPATGLQGEGHTLCHMQTFVFIIHVQVISWKIMKVFRLCYCMIHYTHGNSHIIQL